MKKIIKIGLILIVIIASCHNQLEPETIVNEFMRAIVEADLERAKKVVVQEQWEKLEILLNNRQPILCKKGNWDDIEISGSGGYSSDSNEWYWNLAYQCADPDSPYCIDIRNILLQETDGDWRINDWGNICETDDFSYKCGEICKE